MPLHIVGTNLLRPARGGAAGVVLVFAVGLTLALQAGLFGIALGGILVSWYSKYCFFLFDSVVRGLDEPPVLDISTLNPFGESRPLLLAGVVVMLGGSVALVYGWVGPAAGVLLGLAVALILPASIGQLGLEGNIVHAMSPRHLAQMAHGMGMAYAGVLAVMLGYGLVGLAWFHWMPWQVLRLAGLLFAILSVFSVLAGVLYDRRDELGVEAWHAPERRAERDLKAQAREDDRFLDAAFTQVRLGAHKVAMQLLLDWLRERGHRPEDYRWLCERLSAWTDTRYLRRMTADHVGLLLRLQRNGEALDVVAARLRTLPDFRPGSAITTLQVADIAVRGGAPAVARALVTDFATRFAGDPCVPRAAELARTLDGGSRVD